jgi:hypothetical protein
MADPDMAGAASGPRDRPPPTGGPAEAGVTAGAAGLPERAAVLASDVSEARSPQQRRRLLASATAATRSATRSTVAATRSTAAATRMAALSAARATGRGVRATRRGGQATGRGVRAARRGVGGGTGWLTAQVMAMAPRLRVRNQAALHAQFPGRSPDQIADALIDRAARASAAVGGAVGAWAALPVLPAFPAEIATETLALVGIEIKLVAELHEAYGRPATGNVVERMTAYVGAWANRRGVAVVPGGLILAAGSPLARRLRWRLAARAGRTAFSLAPLLTGAAAGAMLNRRETRRLGAEIQADLRRRIRGAGRGASQAWPATPAQPPWN